MINFFTLRDSLAVASKSAGTTASSAKRVVRVGFHDGSSMLRMLPSGIPAIHANLNRAIPVFFRYSRMHLIAFLIRNVMPRIFAQQYELSRAISHINAVVIKYDWIKTAR